MEQMVVVGKVAGISGMHPTINDGVLGGLLVLEVSLKQTGASRYDLPYPFSVGFENFTDKTLLGTSAVFTRYVERPEDG